MEIKSLAGRLIHDIFEATIMVKGIGGTLEILVAFLFFFFKKEAIYRMLFSPADKIFFSGTAYLPGRHLVRGLNDISLGTQYFIAVYFLFYGIVNLFLVFYLWRGNLWAYPVAIIAFSLFLVYQFYRSLVHHSTFLFFVAVFDIFFVLLTFLEYKRLENSSNVQERNIRPTD